MAYLKSRLLQINCKTISMDDVLHMENNEAYPCFPIMTCSMIYLLGKSMVKYTYLPNYMWVTHFEVKICKLLRLNLELFHVGIS